jgi:hypothetical protein
MMMAPSPAPRSTALPLQKLLTEVRSSEIDIIVA